MTPRFQGQLVSFFLNLLTNYFMPDSDEPEAADVKEIPTDSVAELLDADEGPDELGAFEWLDVIPDDVAVVGTLDDELASTLDDLDDVILREIADRLDCEPTKAAIAREVVERTLLSDEGTERVAQKLDELIELPDALEGLDGPLLNWIASNLSRKLANEILDSFDA